MPYKIVWKNSGRVVPLYEGRKWKTKRSVQGFIARRAGSKRLGFRKVKK